jgi:GGDEF domain-containing protein
VGLAVFPQDDKTVDGLMETADRALYRNKEQHQRGDIFAKQTAV